MTLDRITIDPGKKNGQPCVRGLRITVERVLLALATYKEREELFRAHPDLDDEDIRQAREYAIACLELDERDSGGTLMTRDELLQRISIDPNICFGKACIRGTRIWVALIIEQLASGRAEREILQDYPELDAQDIQAALEHASRGYVLETGRISQSGPAAELLASESIRTAYLGI